MREHEKVFDTVGRGRVVQMRLEDLNMSKGGVLRKDKKLGAESYLTEMLTERERRSVLLPTSRWKNLWDTIIAILVSYTAIMLPIQLCYDNVPLTMPESFVIFDVFVDVAFIADIIFNFRTGFVDDTRIVVDLKMIRKRYLMRWFPIDVVGSFPGDTIFFIIDLAGSESGSQVNATTGEGGTVSNQQANLLTLFKILKVPKLMRLGRLFKSLEKIEGAASVGSIVVLLCIMVVLNHWISCFWFLVTKGGEAWVSSNGLDGLPWTEQYPVTFYTSLMMVMGDSIDVTNSSEHMLASLIVIIGVTMNATVFASIASYAAQISADAALHKNKMNSIRRSLMSLKLQRGLADRIRSYYEYCWTRHRDFASQDLLDELPGVFQRRCAMMIHEDKLRKFGPFERADERFVAALTTKLRPEVYLPEAYILVSGQVYTRCYFIERGTVQVTWPSEARDTVNVMSIDDYFGELSLFVTKKLTYTVRAVTHLDTYKLERSEFVTVMRKHPAGAVHVAHQMDSILPTKLARQVTKEIYDYSGLHDLLSALQPGRWRATRGLAARIAKLDQDPQQRSQLARLRDAQRRRGQHRRRSFIASEISADGGGSFRRNDHSDAPPTIEQQVTASNCKGGGAMDCSPSEGAEASGSSPKLQVELDALHVAQERLEERVEATASKLTAQIAQLSQMVLAALSSGQGGGQQASVATPPSRAGGGPAVVGSSGPGPPSDVTTDEVTAF